MRRKTKAKRKSKKNNLSDKIYWILLIHCPLERLLLGFSSVGMCDLLLVMVRLHRCLAVP